MFEFFTNLFTPVLIIFGFAQPVTEPMIAEPAPVAVPTPAPTQTAEHTPSTTPVLADDTLPEPTPLPTLTPAYIPPDTSLDTVAPDPEPVGEPSVATNTPVEVITEPSATSSTAVTESPPKPVCGDAHKETLLTISTDNLCEVGTSHDSNLDDNEYTWQCASGDQKIACTASITEHGACGVSSDVVLPINYTNDVLCLNGTLTQKRSSYGEVAWQCSGINDGYDALCSANTASSGACGSAHASESQFFPASGLCRLGNATNKDSNGTKHSWECTGVNGGSNATCLAITPPVSTPEIPAHCLQSTDSGILVPPPGC